MASKKTKKVSWVSGARLRTLPLAVSPILAALGVLNAVQAANLALILLCLAVAVFLQLGVNYANDYSDGIRGTDAHRVGPARMTASGSVPAQHVRNVAFGFFALAACAGLAIVLITQMWWLLAIGVAAILAAWFYTGGKSPYGYAGLGEIFVFVFFGLVATILTVFVHAVSDAVLFYSYGVAVAVGLFATAVLMINNIRDIDTDKVAGKRTLAVRMGRRVSKAFYFLMIWAPMGLLVPYVMIWRTPAWAGLVTFLLLPLTLIVAVAKTPKDYILALKLTTYASLAYAALFCLGLSLTA